MIEGTTELTEQQCLRFLEDTLRQGGLADEAHALARGILRTLERVPAPAPPRPPGSFALIVPRFNYLIRDSDVRALNHLRDTLVAIAAAHYLSSGLAVDLLAMYAFYLASLCRILWRKGATVEPVQMWILAALQQHEPATSRTLAERLSNQHVTWTAEQIEQILAGLQRVRLRDKELVAVVQCDDDQRWRTKDLGRPGVTPAEPPSASALPGPGASAPPANTPATSHEALCELMQSLFNEAELRTFLVRKFDGAKLLHDLPPNATFAALTTETVLLLERRGLLDTFFVRALEQFPWRAAAIEAVRARFLA